MGRASWPLAAYAYRCMWASQLAVGSLRFFRHGDRGRQSGGGDVGGSYHHARRGKVPDVVDQWVAGGRRGLSEATAVDVMFE